MPATDPQRLVVLHAVPTWLPVTETWLCNQIRHLPTAMENHVFCEHLDQPGRFPMAHLHALPPFPSPRFLWDRGLQWLGWRDHLGALARTARECRPGILHSHFGHMGWANARMAASVGLCHVTSFYGLDVSFLPRQDPRWLDRYRAMFGLVAAVFCEGPHMGRCLVELGCPPDKVQVHHLGIALDQIPCRPRRLDPGEPLKVLIAASFREKKGIPYALQALGQLRAEGVPLCITLIGDANREPRNQLEKQKIMTALKAAGLEGQVRLLGFQTAAALQEEAYRHHVYLAPSVTAADGDTEGGAPVALIEMLASGMMVVSTEHCDIPEVLDQGRVGLMARERDPQGLATHLRFLVEHPEAWEPLAAAGRRHVEQNYDAAIQGLRLAGHYRRLGG